MQARPARMLPILAVVLASCAEPDAGTRGDPISVPQGLGIGWDWLSHRISVLELTFEPAATESEPANVVAENHGGTFGSLDMPLARYDHRWVQSAALAHENASVWVEIPPGSTVGGEPFSAEVEATLPLGSLRGAEAVLGFVRGYRIDTDRYETPPSFETDPAMPYDPADGFTTLGFGVGVSGESVDGDALRFRVRARNGLGASDRGDVNAAIPQATSWVRVDLVFVAAFGRDASATTGSIAYTIDEAVYGDHLAPPHAPLAQRTLAIEGVPGPERAFVGLRSFDFFLNTAPHYAASCTVAQDPVNYWMEMISGPGRYLREASATLLELGYEPSTGVATVDVDLFATNASGSYEEGNVCLGVRGEVGLLQFDDADAALAAPASIRFAHHSDYVWREPVPGL